MSLMTAPRQSWTQRRPGSFAVVKAAEGGVLMVVRKKDQASGGNGVRLEVEQNGGQSTIELTAQQTRKLRNFLTIVLREPCQEEGEANYSKGAVA